MVKRKMIGIMGSIGVFAAVGAVAIFGYSNIDKVSKLQDPPVQKQVFAAEIVDGDLSNLLINCNSVKLSDNTTTCLFDLIGDQTLPVAGIKVGVGDATSLEMDASTCAVKSSRTIECTDVPVGTLAGLQNIKAKISASPVDTLTSVFVQPSQSVGGEAYYEFAVDGGDPAPKGPGAPLFKSTDDLVVTVKGLKTDLGDVPGSTGNPYTCLVETRSMKNWEDASAWTALTPVVDNSYDETEGCSVEYPKSVRGTLLNWSLRATITNVNTGDIYYAYDNYIFTFAGSGA